MSIAATSENYPVWRSRLRSQCCRIVMAVAGETGFSIIREFLHSVSAGERTATQDVKSRARTSASLPTRRSAGDAVKVESGSNLAVRSWFRERLESARPSPSPRDRRRSAIHTRSSHSTYAGGLSVMGSRAEYSAAAGHGSFTPTYGRSWAPLAPPVSANYGHTTLSSDRADPGSRSQQPRRPRV